MHTQFNGTGFGLIGLNYTAVRSEAADMGLSFTGSLKKKIKLLEQLKLESQMKKQDTTGKRVIKPNKGGPQQ